MSEENEEDDVRRDDGVLSLIIGMVEKGENSKWPITLLSHGFLISGELCSSLDYARGVDDELSTGSFLSEIFAAAKDSPTEDELFKERFFVHLANARFFNTNGNPIPGNRGVYWRGKLAEIAGFNQGMLAGEAS